MNSIFRSGSSSTVLGQYREDLPRENGSSRSEEGRDKSQIRAIATVELYFRVVKTNMECHEELEAWGFCSVVGI